MQHGPVAFRAFHNNRFIVPELYNYRVVFVGKVSEGDEMEWP